MDVKWSKINLLRSLIPNWNPANKGYKISYKLKLLGAIIGSKKQLRKHYHKFYEPIL